MASFGDRIQFLGQILFSTVSALLGRSILGWRIDLLRDVDSWPRYFASGAYGLAFVG